MTVFVQRSLRKVAPASDARPLCKLFAKISGYTSLVCQRRSAPAHFSLTNTFVIVVYIRIRTVVTCRLVRQPSALSVVMKYDACISDKIKTNDLHKNCLIR